MDVSDEFREQFLKAIGQGKPEQPSQADLDVVNKATEIAKDELEQMRLEFLKFQEATKDLVIFSQLKPAIHVLGDAMKSLYELMSDNIDVAQLSSQGKDEYLRAQRVRAAILAKIHQHYNKEAE